MSLNEEVNKIIDTLTEEVESLLKEIDSIGALSPERKKFLREELTVTVPSAFSDVKHSLGHDEESYYFLKPLVVSLLVFGAAFGEAIQGRHVSKLRSDYAKRKQAKDPKQTQKTFVFECWQEWQKKTDRYKSKAAFARDMLNKQEHLTSSKVIEDWCREWERKK